jgi:hypothetical protein
MTDMNVYNKSTPDFLGIGAQKSATTWLYKCLSEHPRIYLPLLKELHYFDRSIKYNRSSSMLAIRSPFKRFFSMSYYKQRYLYHKLAKICKSIVLETKSLNDILWFFNYLFGYYDDRWYISLFAQKKPYQKSGEITPDYSLLDKGDIKHVYDLNPNLKIILLLRNPIDRGWSNFIMEANRSKMQIQDSNFYRFFDYNNPFSRSNYLRGNYIRIIENWSSIFPKDQIYVGFYDDIIKEPKKVVYDILQHIGVGDMGDKSIEHINTVINKGRKSPMPKKYRQFLHNLYYNDNVELYNRLKNPIIKTWLH